MNRSIHEIFAYLAAAGWRRRYLLTVPILVMPLLGLLAGFVVPKNYELKMTILVQEPAHTNPFVNDLAASTSVKDRIAALSAFLHSDQVIDELLSEIGRISDDTPPQTRYRMIKDFGLQLKIALVNSELLDITLRSSRPDGLDKAVDAVAQRVMDRLVAPERDAVNSSEKFLVTEIAQRRADLQMAEDALSKYQAENPERLPGFYNTNVSRLALLQQKLDEKKMDMALTDLLVQQASERVARLPDMMPALGLLQDKIVRLTSELASSRSRGRPSEIQDAEARLKRVEDERVVIRASSKDVQHLQELEARRTSLKKDIDQIQQSLRDGQQAITEFGPVEQEQKRLERSVAAARDMLDSLTKRYEMAQVLGTLTRVEATQRIKILERPTDRPKRVTPPLSIFILAAFAAGIALGGGLAAAAELLDPAIKSAVGLASAAGLPLIAVLDRLEA